MEHPYKRMVKSSPWKEILSQQRIRHFKILHFAYDVGIISYYSKRIVKTRE